MIMNDKKSIYRIEATLHLFLYLQASFNYGLIIH